MVSTVLAIMLFALAAYAAVAALWAVTRHKVLFETVLFETWPVYNIGIYTAATAAIAVAMLLEGLGVLNATPLFGLVGSLIMLAGLAGLFRSRRSF